MKAGIRLSGSGDIVIRDSYVILSTQFGNITLDSRAAPAFVRAVVSRIDGTRDPKAIADDLPASVRAEALAFLDLLMQAGITELTDAQASPPWALPRRLFRVLSKDPGQACRQVRDAAILVIGLEPWGATAAAELAAAGAGMVHVLDGEILREDDLGAGRLWEPAHRGRPRAQALGEVLRRTAPWCEISCTSGSDDGMAGDLIGSREWALLVGGMAAKDVRWHLDAATAAHRARVPYLFASVDGLEARVGPFVRPGRTACWNCCRLRLLANSTSGPADWAVQQASIEGLPLTRGLPGFPPLGSMIGHLLASEALKIISDVQDSRLRGAVYLQNLVTMEASLHPVLPMPWCPTCGGAGALAGPPDAAVPSQRSAAGNGAQALLPGLIDRRTGVIAAIEPRDAGDEPPSLVKRASARLGSYTDGTYWREAIDGGGGKGITAEQARAGAIGEALERYCAARVRWQDLRLSSLARLTDAMIDVIDPRSLGLYDDEQYDRARFPYVRFDPAAEDAWTEGRWFGTGELVRVPALPAYFRPPQPGEQAWCQVTSNGLGAGRSQAAATMHAIFELVERDAFMLSWLARLPGQPVVPDGALEPELHQVLGQLRDCGADVRLYLLDAGVPIPVIACLAFGDGHRWPGVTVATAAHLSPRIAASKAILEQAFSGSFIRGLMLEGERAIPESPEDVRTELDHALFYVPASRAHGCEFIRAGSMGPRPLSSFPEPAVSPGVCAERLAAGGLRVAIVDLTSPDVALGSFRVVRAIAPGAQQLHFGHGLERLGNTRLKELLGTRPDRDPNLDPHPMC